MLRDVQDQSAQVGPSVSDVTGPAATPVSGSSDLYPSLSAPSSSTVSPSNVTTPNSSGNPLTDCSSSYVSTPNPTSILFTDSSSSCVSTPVNPLVMAGLVSSNLADILAVSDSAKASID